MQKLLKSLRITVIKLCKQNLSIRAIAGVNRLKSVFGRIVNEYKDFGRVWNPNKRGKHRKTSGRQDRIIQRIELKAPFHICCVYF